MGSMFSSILGTRGRYNINQTHDRRYYATRGNSRTFEMDQVDYGFIRALNYLKV